MSNTDYQIIANQNEPHRNMRYMGGGPNEEESDKAMEGPGGYFKEPGGYIVDTRAKNSTSIKCEICGIIFITEQDKEQHKKLEHKEHQKPTGVS
jgi:hypothetical protein